MTAFAPMGKAETQESGRTAGALPVGGELEDGGSFDGAATQANGETTEISGQKFSGTVALQDGASCDISLLGIGMILRGLLEQ